MIKDNIRKLTTEERQILLYKIKNNQIIKIDLEIINDCMEVNLNYECICFLLSIDDIFLKRSISYDLKYKLKLEEVKNILNKVCDINVENINEVYELNREKYISEKNLNNELNKENNRKPFFKFKRRKEL